MHSMNGQGIEHNIYPNANQICLCLISSLTNMSNFHLLEVVGLGGDAHNFKWLTIYIL